MSRSSTRRTSIFVRVTFASADLTGADMRRSSFDRCDFANALMAGAILTHEQGAKLDLSTMQRSSIAWADDAGPEPSGG
ncbi:pentapeptide repeat-containing protein [Burkholderia stagnalis]